MNQAFLSHFKISAQEISGLQEALEQGQSLIEVCLEKKLLDEQSYLKWAKDHFGLCILKDEFLNHHNHVQTLLNRYKNVFPKNVVPFYEWDGVIYVMCLEPVEFKAPQAIHYVLAPHYLLQKFATLNESKVQVAVEKIETIESSEVTNPLFKQLSSDGPADPPNFSFQLPNNIATENSAQPPIDALNGMDLKNTTIINLSDLEEPLASDTLGAKALEEEAALEVPQGLSFPPPPQEKPDFAVDRKITSDDLELDKLDLSDNLVAAEEKEQITKIFEIPLPNQIAPAVTKAKVTPGPVPSTVVPMAPSFHSGQEVHLGAFQPLFDQMKKYFNQSMILSYKNNILAPFKWDATWSKDSHSQTAIDISIPSIFRIVCETQKPYHGYVIPNSINDSFFTNWNQSKYPEHITIYPIVANKQLVGMILGTCAKDAAKSFQLHHIESLTALTAQLLTQQPKAA